MKLKNINKQKGLTLIEALIWFALFAAVVVGVFTLYASSREASMVANANKEISTVFAKGNSLYASTSNSSLALADVTPLMMQLGVMPSTLKWDGTKLYNSYGGFVSFVNKASGFVFMYNEVPTGKSCASIVKAQKSVGWDFVIIGNFYRLKYDSTYNLKNVLDSCEGEDGVAAGTIQLQFVSCVSC